MQRTTITISVHGTARNLKWLGVIDGVFSFVAGYSAVFASLILWFLGLGVCLLGCLAGVGKHIARTELGEIPAQMWVVALAFAIVLLIVAAAAESLGSAWRRLMPGASVPVIFVSALLLLACFMEVRSAFDEGSWVNRKGGTNFIWLPWAAVGLWSVLFCILARGVVAAVVLGSTRVRHGDSSEAPYRRLRDVLRARGLLSGLAGEEQQATYNRAVRNTIFWAGGILFAMRIAVQSVASISADSPSPPRTYMSDDEVDDRKKPSDSGVDIQWGLLAIQLVALFWFSSRVSKRLHACRGWITPSVTAVLADDPRPAILFLRSFRDEHNLAASAGAQFVSMSRAGIKSLEEHLTDALWRIGPVIALGRPGQKETPIGAARDYLHDATGEEWKAYIATAASRSGAVLLVAGSTPGLAWEVGHIRQNRLEQWLLVVLPPYLSQRDWDCFVAQCGLTNLVGGLRVREGGQRLLGVTFDGLRTICYEGVPNTYGYQALSLVAVSGIVNQTRQLMPTTPVA